MQQRIIDLEFKLEKQNKQSNIESKTFFDKDIDIIGNCANCGVEFHIHREVVDISEEMKMYGNQQYNQALKDAAEKVQIKSVDEYQGEDFKYLTIDKQSILKLMKSVSSTD